MVALSTVSKAIKQTEESRWRSAGPHDVAESHNCAATQTGNTRDSGHCHRRVNCRYPYVVMGARVPPVFGRDTLGYLETLTRRLPKQAGSSQPQP
jgi:hypothetical protein